MNTDDLQTETSSYLTYLPAIYQQDAALDRPNFLGRFLLAFEKVLTGLRDVDEPGLEETLDGIVNAEGKISLAGIHRYFDPGIDADGNLMDATQRAPSEFLEWLASWVALSLRADLDEFRQRDFIARAVQLYRLRGTKQGLEQLIQIYTRLAPTIDELNTPLQIGVHSTVGKDTWIDGGPPHFFRVNIRLPDPDSKHEQRQKMQKVVAAIIDLEKPAHTVYELYVYTPKMQIGVHSTIGVDTLLGE